jgi:hypothetical protein
MRWWDEASGVRTARRAMEHLDCFVQLLLETFKR